MSSKWTNKLISKAAKLNRKDGSDGSNVNDFLFGPGGPPPSRSDVPSSHPTIPSPVLDLADNDNGLGQPVPPANPRYALRPVRKQKGLHVNFSNEKPALIGEGGDEALLPAIQVRKSAPVVSPISPGGDHRPGTSDSHLSQDNAASSHPVSLLSRMTTRKPAGPSWLQKRKSFNMEEGHIQRQASNTDMASVEARQGHGAALDPDALLPQQPLAAAPLPAIAQLDRLKKRQESPLLDSFRSGAGPVVDDEEERTLSLSSRRWDDLLTHPEVQRKMSNPIASPEQLPDADISDYKSQAQKVPNTNAQLQRAPSDAFAGGFGGLRRGPSPERPPLRPQHQVQNSQQTHTQSSLDNYSAYTPASTQLDKLMAPPQQISLPNMSQSSHTYQLSGYQSSRVAPGPPSPGFPGRQIPIGDQSQTHHQGVHQPLERRSSNEQSEVMRRPSIPVAKPGLSEPDGLQHRKAVSAALKLDPEDHDSENKGGYSAPGARPAIPVFLSRNGSFDAHADTYAAPRLGSISPISHPSAPQSQTNIQMLSRSPGVAFLPQMSREPSNDLSVPAHPYSPPRSPTAQHQTLPSPAQVSPPPSRVAPPATMSARSERTVYEPTRASTTEDFRACIDALRAAFTQSETEARAAARQKTAQWLRIGSWWSLRGRKAFETRIKEQMKSVDARALSADESLNQPFVDVAKAWWITERVLPNISQDQRLSPNSDGFDNSVLQEISSTLRIQVETFIASITRRGLLPHASSLTPALNTKFLVDYPPIPGVVRALTAGYNPTGGSSSHKQDFFSIILADNQQFFSYGHLFADAQITLPDDHEEEDLVMPSTISLIRERTKSQMEMTITTQDGQIDLRIKADSDDGLTWEDVEMRIRSHSMRIKLLEEFALVVRLEKEDFKTLWSIREYNKKAMDEWSSSGDERLIFETKLHNFNYLPPPSQPSPLPTNPIRGCALRLFQTHDRSMHEKAGLLVHTGHRLVVMTAPEMKTLSSVSHKFDANFPILYKYLRGEDQSPALMLEVVKEDQPVSLIPAFYRDDDRVRFMEKLCGSYVASDEVVLAKMTITKMSISTPVPGTPGNLVEIPGAQWHELNIISKANDTDPCHSERFRIAASCDLGNIVDHPVMKPGELKVGLDLQDQNCLKFRRSSESSLTLALLENHVPPGLTQPLQQAFMKTASAPTTVRYQFSTIAEMHQFQQLCTGFRVLYDGCVSSFSIKGQRAAAGMHKKLDATQTRIQVVHNQHGGGNQLLAFFKDMPDGACMSFGLSSTDNYEVSHAGSQKFYLRFVDARFGMPKSLGEPDAQFVSLDLPEFAGERDDIVVAFDKEEEREGLTKALPAAVSKATGLASLKRFVDLGRPSSRLST